MKKFTLGQVMLFIESKPWTIYILFGTIIFILFHNIFRSYFEADEWVHFTYYLPLTRKPDGFFTALITTFFNSGFLSGQGQHINPIGTAIFYLNTKFFGLHYAPYACMSLVFHTLNSYLVFYLLRTFLYRVEKVQKNICAVLGGLFFAIAPTPLHTVTGAAPFYSSNILSVTFFLFCIISFKKAFIKQQKKYIYLAVVFLFLALFSKETTAFLFLLLPYMVIIEKRIFSIKFLAKVYLCCIALYFVIRFIVPNIAQGPGQILETLTGSYIPSAYKTSQSEKVKDTGSITGGDIAVIHKNLPVELLFRSITFPVKMLGTVFVPRQTVFSIVQSITPIVFPIPSGGDAARSQGQLGFLYGPGNTVVIYLISIGLFIFCIVQTIHFIKLKHIGEAQTLAFGIAIILFSALPLVAIIFSFPRWGYDSYFDSRHYYNPTVGAAIIFPFLFFGIARYIAKTVRVKSVSVVAVVLFIVWILYTLFILSENIKQFINIYSSDRREVVEQMRKLLPHLAPKNVFYIETDGLSAYGPVLPFQTSVPQALSVVYYDRSPLPDSFFNKVILDAKPEGYQYVDGRGFGYYTSRKSLTNDLVAKKFSVNDVYAFYYYAQKVKLVDTTVSVRKEMQKNLLQRYETADWKLFDASLSADENVTFFYPPSSEIIDNPVGTTEANLLKDLQINTTDFSVSLKIVHITQTTDINEMTRIFSQINNAKSISKNVFWDAYQSNVAIMSESDAKTYYFIKFDDLLIIALMKPGKQYSVIPEKILGSIAFSKKN